MAYDSDDKGQKARPGSAMSREDLLTQLQEEVSQAETWAAANIREDQERNLQYYLGMPLGNEVDGRSQVISWDVFEIIESAMPSFLEPFFSGDHIGEFSPRTPDDEAYSDQATEVVNYVIKDQNAGFTLFSTWIKDALLSKLGVVRAEWYEQDPERKEWVGLSDEQFTLLMQDPRSEVIEHSARPAEIPGMPPMNEAQAIQIGAMLPQLHDVTVLQKRDGKVCIENVRPENFVVSRGAKSLDKARVVGEFVRMTRSELAEQGYEGHADVSDFAGGDMAQQSIMEMLRDDTTRQTTDIQSTDKSMEEVLLFRGFIRADVNGDGIAEYRQVLAGSFLLDDQEAEHHDYALITPIPVPHRVVGMAYADPAAEIQRLSTTLTRQYLDSLYAANNQKTYVNTTAGVVLEDLLSTRIGGLVRGQRPAAEAITPLATTVVSRDALEGIQMAQGMRESRLGITRYNQGLDSETLNKTATGIQKVMGAADKRQLMTLRIMAETGIKDLFKLVLRLITKYQDAPQWARLRGGFVQFDPRGWSADMDVTISVGIGSGDKTETLMMLQQFGQYMQWAQANGCVVPQNIYEFGKMLAKNAKLKDADTRLLTQPNPNPPPPPPTPEQIKAQTQLQIEQMKQQTQMQVDQNRQEWEARQKQLELQQQAQIEQIKAELQAQLKDKDVAFQQWKAQFDRETQIMLKNIEVSARMKEHDDDMRMQAANGARDQFNRDADRATAAQADSDE
jgi:hypothetical protein